MSAGGSGGRGRREAGPWWVRVLLRLYPRDFREARSAEVVEFVSCELGRGAGLARRTAMAADLARGGVRMRMRGWREATRTGEGWTMGLANDVRAAVRGLMQAPGLALVVVTTLALGIGLNTAVFSVVDGVLLRPLDHAAEGRLVYVQAARDAEENADALISGGDWTVLRERMDALSALEAIGSIRQTLTGAGLPRQVEVGWVSPGFLPMLGVRPALGRLFRPDDPPGTAVLSHTLWQEHLGADPDVVGRTVGLDGFRYTVVGVLPATFRLELPTRGGPLPDIDIWKNPDTYWQNGDIWNERGAGFGMLRMVGVLAPDAPLAAAQAQADGAVAVLAAQDTEYETTGFRVTVHDLRERLVADVRPTLLLLMGAVGFVLLIACANAANLLLVRGHGRVREVAVRVALGGSRWRIARLLLAESLVLAVAGSALGLGVAAAMVGVMPWFAPGDIPRLDSVALDPRAVAFAVLAALGTTFVVGLAPVLHAARTEPAAALGNARAGAGSGGRLRDGLVVVQVALSLVLLVGAGLMVSSLARVSRVDPGFDADGLFTFAVSIPSTDYDWPDEAGRYYRDVQERVAALPGVEAAGVVWPMPFGGGWGGDWQVGGDGGRSLGVVPYYLATEEYFPTAGVPLEAGRLFREGDPREVVVISEEAAGRAFPGESALGRRVRANPWGGQAVDFEVIGVVGDVRQSDPREPTRGGLYFDARTWSWVDWEVHVLARTAVPAGTLVPALRQAVAELDASVPLARPEAMEARVAEATATARFVLSLLGVFAVAAALLAVVGLYGVVSYTVGQRRRELGIRLALGSARRGIEGMVVRRGVFMAGLGVLLGTGAALLLGGILEAWLFEVRPGDPLTLVGAAAAMATAAALASWVPARRAARTDPVEVLKAE